MQTGLDPLPGIPARHARLLAVLVQPPRGIQIQRVTFLRAGQPIQAPMPERTKATQIVSRRSEPLKETRQHRLTGDARDAQQFRRERIAPQIGTPCTLIRLPVLRPSVQAVSLLMTLTPAPESKRK